MNEGWMCSRCKKVNAPYQKQCACGCEDKEEYKSDCLKDIEELKRKLEEEQKRYVPYYPYRYQHWFEWYPDWTYRPYWPYAAPYIVTYTSDSATNPFYIQTTESEKAI